MSIFPRAMRGVVSKDEDYGFTAKQVCVFVFISAVFALLQTFFAIPAPDFLSHTYQVRKQFENFWGALSLIFAVASLAIFRGWWKDNFSRRDKD